MELDNILGELGKVQEQAAIQTAAQVKANERQAAAIEALAAAIVQLAQAVTLLRSGLPPTG